MRRLTFEDRNVSQKKDKPLGEIGEGLRVLCNGGTDQDSIFWLTLWHSP